MIKRILFFLLINFGSLAIGNWLMDNGPQTSWYQNLNQAPWTPPGWVFGAAWTSIMICFSIYMAKLTLIDKSFHIRLLFIMQVMLNISWNFVFFNQHLTLIGLIIISLLTILIFYFFISNHKRLKWSSYLISPYAIWLIIATSLNLYIVLNNKTNF